MFTIENGVLKKEKAYYANFADLLGSNYNKVALALWLLREQPIESSESYYKSILDTFQDLYSKDLSDILLPDASTFEKVCSENMTQINPMMKDARPYLPSDTQTY